MYYNFFLGVSGSLETFSNVLRQQIQVRHERAQQRRRMMEADPFDHEAQRLIAEEIRQKNIEANMEAAMEYNPETFGTVVMLYINCRVNGVPVKAFVDSGAQATIMSSSCAERCNVMRLVDTRWSGIAKGVGVQKIIGRVHVAQVEIENVFLLTSFSVLEDQTMDMLLGLGKFICIFGRFIIRNQMFFDSSCSVCCVNDNITDRYAETASVHNRFAAKCSSHWNHWYGNIFFT